MNLTLTGGAGFLGTLVARALLHRDGTRRLTLVDRAPPPPDLLADPRVRSVEGDLLDLLQRDAATIVPSDTDAVVHLAAAVSGECEADLDLGLRSNLDSTRALLQRCRVLPAPPLFVFSSSLAVFGGTAALPLPPVVTDTTLPMPQNSYGAQKFMGELLVADFARKGLVRGRNLRLMTVSVRPGRPNAAASSFLSAIVREPLAGQRAVCPVAPDLPVALSSPERTLEGLLCAIDASDEAWGPPVALNLPALTTTPAAMVAALRRVAGDAVADRVDWVPDSAVAAIVSRWPSRIEATRAQALGLHADADFDAIVAAYRAAHVGPPGAAAG